jgi:RNA polymerase sigma-70 factor (ECF subfamily)
VTDAAFEVLVERHSAEIYAYLWRLLRDPEQASDCLQDTYLRALRAFPRLRHRDHLRAWLYTIATHQARTLQRETARRSRRHEDLKDEIADPRPSVAKRVADREMLRHVLQAVERLPENQAGADPAPLQGARLCGDSCRAGGSAARA